MAAGCHNGRSETTYREARSVIAEQRAVITDVDTKAVSTVCLIVVLVSIVVAAARIGGPDMFHRWLLSAGLGTLLFSLGLGVATYSESNLFLGPNRAHVRQLVDGDVDAETWERDVCPRTGDWIHENYRTIRWNGGLLALTQLSLFVGVALLVGAVALRPGRENVRS